MTQRIPKADKICLLRRKIAHPCFLFFSSFASRLFIWSQYFRRVTNRIIPQLTRGLSESVKELTRAYYASHRSSSWSQLLNQSIQAVSLPSPALGPIPEPVNSHTYSPFLFLFSKSQPQESITCFALNVSVCTLRQTFNKFTHEQSHVEVKNTVWFIVSCMYVHTNGNISNNIIY